MKKCLIFLSIFTLLTFAAPAEGLKFTDLTELTAEELMVLRQEEAAYLTKISAELGKRVQAGETVNPDEVIGTIAELFPDPNLAKVVRDKAGKFSVSQPVTQADLDSITSLGLWNVGDITDLTGIGRIRNLESIKADAKVQRQLLDESGMLLTKTSEALQELIRLIREEEQMPEGRDKAVFCHRIICPAMQTLRRPVDRLEMIVDKEMWPMPTYGDLLFEL